MVQLDAGWIGPDGLGGAYKNKAEVLQAQSWYAAGGRQGILKGMSIAGVSGSMALDIAAGACLISRRDGAQLVQDMGYTMPVPTTTRVTFGPASPSARNDALVAAVVDTTDGAVGTGGLAVGGQLIVVPGVSGTTTTRTDAQIAAYLGRGGFIRLADVPIASTDTQITMANLVDQRSPACGVWWPHAPKVYASAAPTTPVAVTLNTDECQYIYLSSNTVHARANANVTGTVVAAIMDLPVVGSHRHLNCGTAAQIGTSVPTDQTGVARMYSPAADKLICSLGATGGFRDITAGNSVSYSVTYKV